MTDALRPELSPEPDDTEAPPSCIGCGGEIEGTPVLLYGETPACEACVAECDTCGRQHLACDTYNAYVGSTEQSICQSCFDRLAWWCESCRTDRLGDQRYTTGDCGPYCSGCIAHEQEREDEEERRAVIGAYHSPARRRATYVVPSPWLKATGRPYGVELEVERKLGRNAPQAHEIAADLLEAAQNVPLARNGRLLWAEHDGSLSDGFELISAPGGLDLHRELWGAVLAHHACRHLRSHDTDTCGLHVHASRDGLSVLQVARYAAWMHSEDTAPLLHLVARRHPNQYCQPGGTKVCRRRAFDSERYRIVNTSRAETVEVRIFRGSLRLESVLAAVEFVHAGLGYVGSAGASPTVPGFLQYIHRPERAKDTRELRAMLRRRIGTYEGVRSYAPVVDTLAALPVKVRSGAAVQDTTTTTEE